MAEFETSQEMPDIIATDVKPKNPQAAKAEAEEKPAEQPEAKLNGGNIDALMNVKLDVRVVLGRSRMSIAELLELTKGSVVELDRKVGEPIDLMINDRIVARGDLVKVNGDFIGVALREIVKDFVQAAA